MADQAQPRTLDEIEQRISSLRIRYLRAVSNGHDGEAEFIEDEIDANLDEWDSVHLAKRKAAT